MDLDVLERNISRMAARARVAGVKLRPHAKTHKCPEVGKRQIALGAVGMCCQKVSEAEAMVEGGITDVLVSNEVVGATKIARLADLSRRARIGVCVDNAPTLREIEHTAPYMHDGSLQTLEEVVEFYNKGGIKNKNLDVNLKPLNLTDQEKKDLVAFLKALSGEGWQTLKAPSDFPK